MKAKVNNSKFFAQRLVEKRVSVRDLNPDVTEQSLSHRNSQLRVVVAGFKPFNDKFSKALLYKFCIIINP